MDSKERRETKDVKLSREQSCHENHGYDDYRGYHGSSSAKVSASAQAGIQQGATQSPSSAEKGEAHPSVATPNATSHPYPGSVEVAQEATSEGGE